MTKYSTKSPHITAPKEVVPLVALGANLQVRNVQHDWANNSVTDNLPILSLPADEKIKSSTQMDFDTFAAARDQLKYACHDLFVVYEDRFEEPHILMCQRTEAGANLDHSVNHEVVYEENAPINGFWWPLGGRILVPGAGSEIENSFTEIHSALYKLKQEAGYEPKNVLDMFFLGIGNTSFERRMTYLSKAVNEDGSEHATSKCVKLNCKQNTINDNYVVVVDSKDFLPDSSVTNLRFFSRMDYFKYGNRELFCPYVQTFMDAIFQGWETYQNRNRAAA